MSIREILNRNPRHAAAVAGTIAVVAVACAIWSLRPVKQSVSQGYYSDDDGKTFFIDDVQRIYPFDHDGKPAYRAFVYQCGDSPRFVSYLARYPDGAKTRIAALQAKGNDPDAAGQLAHELGAAIEVRKPGETKWVSLYGSEGQTISLHPRCPDGTTAKPQWP